MAEKGSNPKDSPSGKNTKSPNILDRVKEEIEATFHHDKSPRHHKETHGMSDDIDEKTEIDDVKAPGVFEANGSSVLKLSVIASVMHKTTTFGAMPNR